VSLLKWVWAIIGSNPLLIKSPMTETWSIFSQNDVLLSIFGGAGFVSVILVMTTVLGRNDKRERNIKRYIETSQSEDE